MNETFTQKVIVALLIILVALSGVSMYVMNAQLRSITQLLQTSSSSSLQQACVTSGGELQNGTCVCERDYVLENGMCMGQDGMTQKELNEVKIGQEKLMKQTACLDSGGSFTNGSCDCGDEYTLENGECVGAIGGTKKEIEESKVNQERLLNSR
ncbi:hypothetical protein IPH19_00050 [Candidatus Uhrbacteria bacterium]|nr:MAG: hypothetical protein IPH19_00050 [Candidatus Uhrbacteria bacterium]